MNPSTRFQVHVIGTSLNHNHPLDAFSSIPDFTLIKNPNPDISDIPEDAFVTDEDTKGLKRAHRKADRIIQYADDVSLIASFHYRVIFFGSMNSIISSNASLEEKFSLGEATRTHFYHRS